MRKGFWRRCDGCGKMFQVSHGNQKTHEGECRRKRDLASKKRARKRADQGLGGPAYFIYAIGPEVGFPVKIGFSNDPDKRREQLQTSSWERMVTHSCCYVRSKSAALRMERLLHKKLDESGKRRRGEWFNIFADEAKTAIREVFAYQHKLEELKYNDNWDDKKTGFYGYVLE